MVTSIKVYDHIIDTTWTEFKDFIDGTNKNLLGQYVDVEEKYFIFAVDGKNMIYIANIYKDGLEPGGWTAQQISDNADDRTDFLSNFASGFNQQIS